METEMEVGEELRELLVELLDQFEMEQGYPTTSVETPDGREWGMVTEELTDILMRIAGVIDYLSEDDEGGPYEITFELFGNEDGEDED